MFNEEKYEKMCQQIRADIRAPLTVELQQEFDKFCSFMQLYETEQRLLNHAFEKCMESKD